MTLRYRVQQWLAADGSFQDGVGLLEMAGDRSASRYRPVLSQAFVNSTQKDQLRRQLVRLLGSLPEEEQVVPAVVQKTDIQRVPDTPRIIAIRNEARNLHKVRSDLKTQLLVRSLDSPDKYTDEERLEIAKLIMEDNVPSLDKLYDQIRRFEQEGIEPADDEQLIRERTVAQMRKVMSLRPQISRLKKELKQERLSKSERADKEKELAEKQSERDALEQLLGL